MFVSGKNKDEDYVIKDIIDEIAKDKSIYTVGSSWTPSEQNPTPLKDDEAWEIHLKKN